MKVTIPEAKSLLLDFDHNLTILMLSYARLQKSCDDVLPFVPRYIFNYLLDYVTSCEDALADKEAILNLIFSSNDKR